MTLPIVKGLGFDSRWMSREAFSPRDPDRDWRRGSLHGCRFGLLPGPADRRQPGTTMGL